MQLAEVNPLAILVAAIAPMVIGFLWYGPLFGKAWMQAAGVTQHQIEAQQSRMGPQYALTFLAAIVTAFALGEFVSYSRATTLVGGILIGFLAWFGFVATASFTNSLFEGRSAKLFFLNNGNQLVNLAVMGAILGVWPA